MLYVLFFAAFCTNSSAYNHRNSLRSHVLKWHNWIAIIFKNSLKSQKIMVHTMCFRDKRTWSDRAERWGLSHRCSLTPLGQWHRWSHSPVSSELQRGRPSQRRSRLFEGAEGHDWGDHLRRLRKFHNFACRPRSFWILKRTRQGRPSLNVQYSMNNNEIWMQTNSESDL